MILRLKYQKNIAVILFVAFLLAYPIAALAGNPFSDAFGKVGGFFKNAGGAIAGFGKKAVGAAGNIADAIKDAFLNALINLFFQIPLAISATFWLLTAGLVKFVLSPDFLGIPITSSGTAVYEMWQTVRDFTNMLFVLALVAIGLGTALRYGEYQIQRALPKLIFIAFLINFTPVIVGFFIDVANITIRFLVTETAGDHLLQMAKKAYDGNLSLFERIFSDSPFETLAAATAQLFFNIIATIVYLLFFLLYFFRYVALIIAFILSPLAFFSFILPATRGFWNMWWRQFIAWLLVGVTGAFFIFLAEQMVGVMWEVEVDVGSGIFKGFTEFVNVLVTAMVPIAFLVMGFLLTVSTSAMGAKGIIAVFEKGRKRVQAWAMKEARQRIEQGASERTLAIAHAEKRTERMTLAGREIPGTGTARKIGWWATAPIRGAAKAAAPYALEMQAKAIDQEMEQVKKYRTPERLYAAFRFPAATKVRKAGILMAAIENKQLGALKKLGLKDEEIAKTIRDLAITAPSKASKIAKAVPHLADRIAAQLPEEQAKAIGLAFIDEAERQRYQTLSRKLYATASPKDIENWSPDMLIHPETKEWQPEAIEGIMHWKGAQLGAAARSMHSQFVDKYMEYAESHPERISEVQRDYLKRAPAQEFGFRPLPPETAQSAPRTQPPPPPGWTVRPSGMVIPPQRPRRTRPVETIGEAEETPGTKPSSPKRTRPAETPEETE